MSVHASGLRNTAKKRRNCSQTKLRLTSKPPKQGLKSVLVSTSARSRGKHKQKCCPTSRQPSFHLALLTTSRALTKHLTHSSHQNLPKKLRARSNHDHD